MITENDFPISIRGRNFSLDDLQLIRDVINSPCFNNRAAISRELCRQLNWYTPKGHLKDAACRYVLIKLHQNNLITLPAPRRNPFEKKKIKFTAHTEPQLPITENAGNLKPLQFELVTNIKKMQLWKEYIERYHYLGYKVIVGPQIKYFITCDEGLLGCIAFGGAAWSVKPRDKWIGWINAQRKQNLNLIINNVRFLIFPWIHSKNLASMILSQVSKIAPRDWQKQYGYRPVLMETFVDKQRFDGASYKAANWIYVGDTQGRGKMDRLNQYPNSIKKILLYPLCKNVKCILGNGFQTVDR